MERHGFGSPLLPYGLSPRGDRGSSARGGGTDKSRRSTSASPPLPPAACHGPPRVASLSVVGVAGHQVTPEQASLMRLIPKGDALPAACSGVAPGTRISSWALVVMIEASAASLVPAGNPWMHHM
jgi:hypothetical protein